MRLAQKGYRVALLEMGKRFTSADFPRSNWQVTRYLWIPLLRCFGIQKISVLKGLLVLHGVGVGGGSLVYANTMMRPGPAVFKGAGWPPGIDWAQVLAPHYEMAMRIMGVTPNPHLREADLTLQKLAQRLGAGATFHGTDVAVHFGAPNEVVADPYFSGAGPGRAGCDLCGGCMIGCHNGSKNTLDKNYLYFAEKWGAHVIPETRVTRITPEAEGYAIETVRSTQCFMPSKTVFHAHKVILAAGVLGTVGLLLKNRDVYKTLPRLSRGVGEHVRTNGESLVGATSLRGDMDLSRGVAIGSAFLTANGLKVEAVRYPAGSGAMRMLAVPLTGNGTRLTRPFKLLAAILMRLPDVVRLWSVRDWAKRTLILLIMSADDARIRLRIGRSVLTGFSRGLVAVPSAQPVPSYIPVAQEAAQVASALIGGTPQNTFSEVLLGAPATAHILGGACMASAQDAGVVDTGHEVFGHAGLYVCDGSVVPSNLGVNPSLTIIALAERFAAQFPSAPGADTSAREVHFS